MWNHTSRDGAVRGTHSQPLPQNFLIGFVKIPQVTLVVARGIRTVTDDESFFIMF